MAEFIQQDCCGWWEFRTNGTTHNLETFFNAAKDDGLLDQDGFLRGGGILLTDVSGRKYASRYISLLKKAKLGRTVSLPSFINPNTAHKLKSYVWFPNKQKLKAYLKKHGIIVSKPIPLFGRW